MSFPLMLQCLRTIPDLVCASVVWCERLCRVCVTVMTVQCFLLLCFLCCTLRLYIVPESINNLKCYHHQNLTGILHKRITNNKKVLHASQLAHKIRGFSLIKYKILSHH
jgi:hypothetical protein